MSEQRDEDIQDIAESHLHEQARPHVKRWKTFQDWVTTVGGMVAIIGSIAAGVSFLFGVLPFIRTDLYANDQTVIDRRISAVENISEQNTAALTTIQRTGMLSLQLQLKSRIDLINTTLNQITPNNQAYFGLQSEKNTAQQQLDEITRQLNR